ncbi:MAG: hypothetical protein WC729_06045 [Sphingomonas sp.]|uniref:hypothetical protein n=1 Tax=Sphingomonas sp. TaxID=28214 RepID=UPI003564168F
MPYNADLDALAAIADAPDTKDVSSAFADYCRLRASGRRREALEQLDRFIVSTEEGHFDHRRAFVRWVTAPNGLVDSRLLTPQPVIARIIVPTVDEWRDREPDDAEAYFLKGRYGDWTVSENEPGPLDWFRRAIELAPDHQGARRAFIDWVVGHVENAQHELPLGYLGSPEGDLAEVEEALRLLDGVEQPHWRVGVGAKLTHLRDTTEAWVGAVG